MKLLAIRLSWQKTPAEACFRRYVLPHTNLKSLHYQRLPSTSPAHASMSYASKLQAWQVVRPQN